MGLLGGAIRDAAQNFGMTLDELRRGPMAAFAARFGVTVPTLDRIAADAPATVAYVSHSRLIAGCPDCNGAEFVYRDGPHLFMCQSCWNGAIGGKWRLVLVPDVLPEVEAILGERPIPQSRNWHPTETLAQLRAENEERL